MTVPTQLLITEDVCINALIPNENADKVLKELQTAKIRVVGGTVSTEDPTKTLIRIFINLRKSGDAINILNQGLDIQLK